MERRGSVEDAYRGGRYFPVGKFAPNSPDSGLETESERFIDTTHHSTPFWRQYCILVKRYYSLATRDPTMYLLQFILSIVLAFFIGAVFFKLPRRIDISMNNIPAGILWIVFLMSFIQIFKVRFSYFYIDDLHYENLSLPSVFTYMHYSPSYLSHVRDRYTILVEMSLCSDTRGPTTPMTCYPHSWQRRPVRVWVVESWFQGPR